MEKQFEVLMNKQMITLKIVWAALLVSITILAGLTFFLPLESTQIVSPNDPNFFIFPIVALASSVLSILLFEFLKKKILSSPLDRQDFLYRIKESRTENGQPIYSLKDTELINSLDDRRLKIFRVQKEMFTAYLLRWALTEVIAVMGFLFARLNSAKNPSLVFFVFAIVLMLIGFPKAKLSEQHPNF